MLMVSNGLVIIVLTFAQIIIAVLLPIDGGLCFHMLMVRRYSNSAL